MAALEKEGQGEMKRKVGIVIISYNASTAVRVTLASLRHARNEVPSSVLLIDNASNDLEREKIRLAFDRHVQEEGPLSWEYVQLDRNLGFSGGNNVGIRRFLENQEITHICLLNSDVIVTDHWLDRLVEAECDVISAVTNKADSEQCVPVDFEVELDQCLDERIENIPAETLSCIKSFAEDWHTAWKGNLTEADATFFCVLLTKRVVQKVGLLDETFFPGGYEDDDYCLRLRQEGFKVHLARDVFIHHWGSASFGQLQYAYFNNQAQRNRDYLEEKHGIVLRRRPEKPFVSYLMDLRFARFQGGDKGKQRRFNAIYSTQLKTLLEHYETEFKNLSHMLKNSSHDLPPVLEKQIQQALVFGDLTKTWGRISSVAEAVFEGDFTPPVSMDDLLDQVEHLAEGVRTRVECNFAMHALLFPPSEESDQELLASRDETEANPPMAGQGRLRKLIWLLKRGAPFLWNLRGIVFFGGYPYPERQSDGYFQRIQIVDGLFMDRWRIYVESDELPGRNLWFDRPQPKVLVLRITGGPRRRLLVRALALLAVIKCRKVYFHSVLRMHDNRFGRLMHVPGLKKVIDIHGVVPEEFRFHNDFFSALLYEREEKLAVLKSDMAIVVTGSMQNYLNQKYREELKGQVAIFPMFPNVAPSLVPRAYVEEKPVVVYAGGLHKWQQVPKMIDAITRTASLCAHRFYCPEPEVVRAMLPESVRTQVIVDRKAHEELIGLYAECHYGFILREDIVVNHVACPTKLVEYLAMGIVPIVDCEDIGDFKDMGMQFVPLDDFLKGNLPTEERRAEMAHQNFSIYERLREIRKQGARNIYDLLTDIRKPGAWSGSVAGIKRFLPPDTHRGRVARAIHRYLKTSTSNTKNKNFLPARSEEKKAICSEVAQSIPDCDVLVQVDNFEAGGLENVVLDLNDTLIRAGYRVVLLVLGTAGAGVQQAHERGIPVLLESPDAESYRTIIDRLNPRLLLTHYSIHGADLCHERGIPFVQVIHNTYMWFDASQREAFMNAAQKTTAFVAVSEYAKDYSVSRLGIEKTRCVVIPNGIDCASFEAFDWREARQEIRTKHGLKDDDFVFLSVGSINHQKNHFATVRAFARVCKSTPRAKLVIVGPTYEKSLLEEIEQFVIEKGLDTRVIYGGSTPGAQKYYAMADAFVSAAFFEGGGLNHIEAMRANLPSVMSKVGYALDLAALPGVEIVDPPLDIAEFTGAIWQLASTPEFEYRLGEAMAQVYESRRTPDLPLEFLDALDKSNAYRCYVELIETLLSGQGLKGESFSFSWPYQLSNVSSKDACAVG